MKKYGIADIIIISDYIISDGEKLQYIIDDRKYHFRSAFDTETGAYVRTGILDKN